MRFGWFGALGMALTFVVAGGCSSHPTPESERVGASRGAIQGGTTDTTHTFVVGVHGRDSSGSEGFCSGTLVTPNLVITARHCVDQSPQQILCENNPSFGGRMWQVGSTSSQLKVTTNTSSLAFSGPGWHNVKQIDTPTDAHICGNDIALLTLADLVPASEATPAIPGVQYPMDDLLVGYSFSFTAIGYGATDGTGQTGVGTRRIKSNIGVVCVPNSDTAYDCPTTDAMGKPLNLNPREFPGGDGTCEGDSGSGAFDQQMFGMGKFLTHGILSRGGVDSMNNCQGSLYTRLDAWRDLVVNTATSASNNWTLYGKPNPDWTIYVPPPVGSDGGAGDSGKPTTKPSGGGIGQTCSQDSDCASKLCKDPGNGTTVCSQDCKQNACPDGYTCSTDTQLCFVSQDTTPQGGGSTTTTTSGCSVTRDPTKPIPWRGVLAGAALALGAVLRRRNRS